MNRQGTEKKRKTNGELREELIRELRHLRGLVREAGENFILRREGEIETLIDNLSAVSAGNLRAMGGELLHDIRALKVKPEKGRLKDLKGIDGLIEELADRVITAQGKGKGPGKG